jgi:hypothetical protein
MDLFDEPLVSEAFINPKNLLIWTGAGISYNSGIPLADDLIIDIFSELSTHCNYLSPNKIKRIYHRFYNTNRSYPRLEFLLDKILWLEKDVKLIQEGSFSTFMKVFESKNPNNIHLSISEQYKYGAKIVTANFDTIIDDCIINSDPKLSNILHYHGDYLDAYKCGGTLRRIALGLNHETELQLEQWLREAKYVIFIGYSGRDYFDIIPLFKRLSKSLQNALWINHTKNKTIREANPKNNVPEEIISAFKNFKFLNCNCDKYFNTSKDVNIINQKKVFISDFFQAQKSDTLLILSLEILRNIGLLNNALSKIVKIENNFYKGFNNKSLNCLFDIESRVVVGLGKYKFYNICCKHWREKNIGVSIKTIESINASAAFSGLRMIQVLPVFIRSLKLLFISYDTITKIDNNRLFWWYHEHLHIIVRFFHVLSHLKILSFFTKKCSNKILFIRNQLYSEYLIKCREELINPDIELLESLRAEINQTEIEFNNWFESDNLIQTSIVKRKMMEKQYLSNIKSGKNHYSISKMINKCVQQIECMESIGSYYVAARWYDLMIALNETNIKLAENKRRKYLLEIELGSLGKLINHIIKRNTKNKYIGI